MIVVVSFAVLLLVAIAGFVTFAFRTARRIEAEVPPVGRFMTVDGLRVHYVDIGSGPVIVMIHGLAAQLQSFTFALGARLSGYRLLILDRPGSGYSQAGPAGLKGNAKVVVEFLKALGIDQALIVGHSLGGAIALALAVDHPEVVAGLALLAPATQMQAEPPEALRGLALRSDLMRWIVGWTLAVPLSLRREPNTLEALFGPDPVPPDFGTRGGGLLPLRPWAFRNACRDLAAVAGELEGYVTRYGEIEKPVGVLFGTADRILDFALHGVTLRGQIAGLELEPIEQGGHMVPLAAPERSAAFIGRMAARAGLVTA